MKRGKKKESGESLEDYKKQATRNCLVKVKEIFSLTYMDLQNQISEFETEILEIKSNDLRELYSSLKPRFQIDDNTLNRLIKNNIIPYRNAINAIYLWVKTKFSKIYDECEYEVRLTYTATTVGGIKELLGHGRDLNINKTRSFEGVYALYRPFHLSPKDHVTIALFEIGRNVIGNSNISSEFNCKYYSEYIEYGHNKKTFAEGKVIPHGDRLLAILSTEGKGSFTILFDEVNESHDSYERDNMGGILIAALNKKSSAWPVFVQRFSSKDDFKIGTINASELYGMNPEIFNRLRRGAIHWSDDLFTGFGGAKSHSALGKKKLKN